jgi:hypothetical protein
VAVISTLLVASMAIADDGGCTGSDGGIWPTAVFRSRRQAEDQTLQTISHLTGQRRLYTTDRSWRSGLLGAIDARDGVSTMQRNELNGVTPNEVRRIPPDCALLITHWQRSWTSRTKETPHADDS